MKILKLSLVLVVLIVSANVAYSQIGVRAGVNIATQSSDEEDDDVSSIIGLNLGLTYEHALSDRLSIQPELHFIQKGAKVEFDDFFGSGEISTTLNYLELAVMGKYTIADIGDDGGLYLGITPHLGFGLSGKYKFEFEGESETEDVDFDDDGLNRMDFGVGFGLGASFGNIYLDVRYNLGLANVADDDDFTINNRGILIGVGYKF